MGIGLQLDPSSVFVALGLGSTLLVAAVIGKLVGAGLPAHWQSGAGAGTLMGVSMIPRAEIALIVIHTGSKLGEWAVPPQLYGAMVFVSACTCIFAPIVLRILFARYPQFESDAKPEHLGDG